LADSFHPKSEAEYRKVNTDFSGIISDHKTTAKTRVSVLIDPAARPTTRGEPNISGCSQGPLLKLDAGMIISSDVLVNDGRFY